VFQCTEQESAEQEKVITALYILDYYSHV